MPTKQTEEYKNLHIQYIKELSIIKNKIDSEIQTSLIAFAGDNQFYPTMRVMFETAIDLIDGMHEEGTVYVPD